MTYDERMVDGRIQIGPAYEIKDRVRTEQTAPGLGISVRIHKDGPRHIAARSYQAGYANFEVFAE